MHQLRSSLSISLLTLLTFIIAAATSAYGDAHRFRRPVPTKPVYGTLPQGANTDKIVLKLKEGMGQPESDGQRFLRGGQQWDLLNAAISSHNKAAGLESHFSVDKNTLNKMRLAGSRRVGQELADLTLYYNLTVAENATPEERLELVNQLNELDIVEVAYFAPKPALASIADAQLTPAWESQQYYLQAAPTGVNAYYGWDYPGGRGADIKVIDIEGNWIETHEDLHGGTDHFHIAGSRINDPGWWNHGTAVLGEIAADSNSFGMTGIAFDVDLGTVSIGSMSTADAIITATNNSDVGDIILIELHAPGPHYDFQEDEYQLGYVPMEYWMANFDAIVQASALGRIVVEAGGNGAENLDDTYIYGSIFDPDYRFSGAIMVAASDAGHVPASFTNYGRRLDVHAFGTWDVYTLGYGDLYGTGPDDYYTATFAGTSSASPIIVGACAILQGVHKAAHGWTLDHSEMRALLQDHSTPQAPDSRHIGPLPDLQGSVDEVVGVSFFVDTSNGWVPLEVYFEASSGLQVDTWTWDFGDGDSAFIQSPTHTYQEAGVYDVTVQIDAQGDIRSVTKHSYIIALADTMQADSAQDAPGTSVEITISANNTVPINSIRIPLEYPGDLNLSFDSASTSGCRTDYFDEVELIHYDPFNRRFTYKVDNSFWSGMPDLEPGSGAILKVYLKIHSSASSGQSAAIELDGYQDYAPRFSGPMLTYETASLPGAVTLPECVLRGDLNGDSEVNIADLLYFVEYSFNDGPPPVQMETADVECSGTIDINDLLYLVEYMFNNGPDLCPC